MIDKKISIGTLVTMITIVCTFIYTQGIFANKVESVEEDQSKNVVRIKKNEDDIVNLKVGVAKIETQLDDRFDRLEEILMEIE